MRLRTFTAPSIGEAMRQVRTALGEDAVILSTEQVGKQVKVTAAIETGAAPAAAASAARRRPRTSSKPRCAITACRRRWPTDCWQPLAISKAAARSRL